MCTFHHQGEGGTNHRGLCGSLAIGVRICLVLGPKPGHSGVDGLGTDWQPVASFLAGCHEAKCEPCWCPESLPGPLCPCVTQTQGSGLCPVPSLHQGLPFRRTAVVTLPFLCCHSPGPREVHPTLCDTGNSAGGETPVLWKPEPTFFLGKNSFRKAGRGLENTSFQPFGLSGTGREDFLQKQTPRLLLVLLVPGGLGGSRAIENMPPGLGGVTACLSQHG